MIIIEINDLIFAVALVWMSFLGNAVVRMYTLRDLYWEWDRNFARLVWIFLYPPVMLIGIAIVYWALQNI